MRRAVLSGMIGLALCIAASCVQAQTFISIPKPEPGPLEDWAVAVIAADWRTKSGEPTMVFDNARSGLVDRFVSRGFDREGLYEASLRPDVTDPVSMQDALSNMARVTEKNTRGCLLYITSSGSPEGLVFGPDARLTPSAMATVVNDLCGQRPTVVIVSACYSGGFIDALSGSNRMVMTSEGGDGNAVGCSEDATEPYEDVCLLNGCGDAGIYPYFDACVVTNLRSAEDFIDLFAETKACVASYEKRKGLSLSSEPQVRIGVQMQSSLPRLRFQPVFIGS